MRDATDTLRKQGLNDTPRLDAELLLCKVAGITRTEFFTHPEASLSDADIDALASLLSSRLKGVPIAHLIGQREFWSFDLEVNSDVLIPRPDTETLVSAALERLPTDTSKAILELGTGSGAIAIALASECEHPIIASDISDKALAVARRNAARHSPNRIDFIQSNWFSAFASPVAVTSSKIAMVLSNPPYLAPDDSHLADLQYEPRDALVADDNGFAAFKIIIKDATNVVVPGGIVLFEHGKNQGEQIRELFTEHGYTSVETVNDLAGLERVTLARCTRNSG